MQRYFRISAPAVHQMVVTLSDRGFIVREPGRARSIRLLLSRASYRTWSDLRDLTRRKQSVR